MFIGAVPKLNVPRYARTGGKKFVVFVRDPQTGRVKKVRFGQRGARIKRNDPERRRSFRARHKCNEARDVTSARYWSCKMW